MDYVKDLLIILGVLTAIAALAIKFHTYTSNKLSNNIKEYEIYKEVRDLLILSEGDVDLASIHVALSCIISRELSIEDIKWFVHTPCAFKHIRDFSSQERYLNISDTQTGFDFKKSYLAKKTRVYEGIVLFLSYTFFGTLGAVIFIYGHLLNIPMFLQIILYGFRVVSWIIALAMLHLGMILSDTERMIKRASFNSNQELKLHE
jgi:hypothetical protein